MTFRPALFGLAALAACCSALAGNDAGKIPAPVVTVAPSNATQGLSAAPRADQISAPAVQAPLNAEGFGEIACSTDFKINPDGRIGPASCDSSARTFSREPLESTDEISTGAALGKLDPSVNYRSR